LAPDGEQFDLEITFRREYVEDEHPMGDLVFPAQSPDSYIRVSAPAVNKILIFLATMSIVCLGALVIAHVPIVQAAAVLIWLGSLRFAYQMFRPEK
jgi:hypothetical protein